MIYLKKPGCEDLLFSLPGHIMPSNPQRTKEIIHHYGTTTETSDRMITTGEGNVSGSKWMMRMGVVCRVNLVI